VRAGFQPVAADLFADADLRAIATATRIAPYPEGLIDWLRAIEPPAWMYTGALENYPELVDQMGWIAPLLGNAGDVLTRVRSPWELGDVLGRANFLFPETRDSLQGLPHDGSWLMKTYQGASGSGVRSLERWAGSEEPGDQDDGERSVAVYQRRVAGVPCSAVYVAAEGAATLLGITRQLIGESWLGSHGFQYAGSIGPLPVGDQVRQTIVRLGDVLSAEFELTGLFGVDFMLDGDDLWVLEVNPRYTASVEIVERFAGVCAIGAHVAACGGRVEHQEQAGAASSRSSSWRDAAEVGSRVLGGGDAPARSYGKAVLYARREVLVSRTFSELSLAEAVREPWPMLADVSPAGTVIDEGRPLLTIFGEGANDEEVAAMLRARCAELEAMLYD
jgi:predicted ATP-grasp superfamily ATP-dependent carboligase